jgi:hypothetical protein
MRNEKEYFPDGTEIGEWFYETEIPKLSELGRPYSLKDFAIPADGTVQTERIQNVIDQAAENGGRTDIPVSKARHITLRNCEFDSDVFFNVKADEEQYHLSDFTLENITVRAADISFCAETIENLRQNEVVLIQKEERSYTDAVTTL